MKDKIDILTNGLMKIYSGGNSNLMKRFEDGLENIDWNKQMKKHRLELNLTRVLFIITTIALLFLFALLIIGIIQHKKTEISLASAVGVCCGCLTTSIAFQQSIARYKAFKILKDISTPDVQ